MSGSKRTKSDIISASIQQYLALRGIQQKKSQINVSELATLSVLERESSVRNLVAYSVDKLDFASAESQYSKFRVWISESKDHYKPELAQLLYPVFTHIYIRLLGIAGAPAAAHKFHKRHLSTFQGNPEFKLFIQQLGEANSTEDLKQNPSISAFRGARYSVTLTNQTYTHLLSYLQTTQSDLILNVLNQEVDVTVGDPLGTGSRQEIRASLSSPPPAVHTAVEDANKDDVDRLSDLSRAVKESSPVPPSIALYRVQSEEGVCVSAEVDFKGRQLVCGGEDSVVRLWQVLPSEEPVILDVDSSTLRLGCDSDHPASSSTERIVEQTTCRSLRGHSGTVYSAVFLPGDRHIVSTSEDTTVRIWDKENGAGLSVLNGHLYPVWCAASDCIGVNFVTGSMDRTARLWRPELAYPLRVFVGHEQDVDCVSFHPNCYYIVTGSCDRTVRLWSVTEGRCVRVLIGSKGAVSNVQISPCGRFAASSGEDKKIRIWDLAQGKLMKDLKGHTDTVTCLTWWDSRMLCTAGMDGTIKVWDVGVGENELMESYPVGGTILGCNFTDTNTLVAVAQDTNPQSMNGS